MSVWRVPEIWKNGEVWIIGGGPSIPKLFGVPDSLIEQVMMKKKHVSVFSPYLTPLHSRHIIAINAAFMLGSWIDIMFFGDNGFYTRFGEKISTSSCIRVTCADTGSYESWRKKGVKMMKRKKDKQEGITELPGLVSWNNNSGAASISLAVQTGVKRIILLGFDMDTNEKGKQHWHSVYKANPEDDLPTRRLPFARHMKGFPAIARDAQKLGVQIINASPDSKINLFKKCHPKELL